MPPTPEFPHYPTAQQPKRRTLSRWWLGAAIAFAVTSVALLSVGAVLMFKAVESDLDTYIDDPAILAVVQSECHTMTKTVEGMIVTGTLRHQAEIITKQDDAVQKMVDAVRALDPELLASDKPTLEWTYDWEKLINQRSVFAAELERGHLPELTMPTDPDGDPILDRMDWASSPECVVPEALLNPYPEEVEDI